VGFQYPAVLIPWLFLAAVEGLARLERWPRVRPLTRKWLPLGLLLAGTVGANLPFNPVYVSWRSGYFSRLPHQAEIDAALAQVPPLAGVATLNPFGPHLTERRVLIGLEKYASGLNPDHLRQADYVLLDLVDCRLFHSQDPRGDYAQMTREILDTQAYGVRYRAGRILLLQRDAPPGPALDEVRAYVDDLEAQGRPCWP